MWDRSVVTVFVAGWKKEGKKVWLVSEDRWRQEGEEWLIHLHVSTIVVLRQAALAVMAVASCSFSPGLSLCCSLAQLSSHVFPPLIAFLPALFLHNISLCLCLFFHLNYSVCRIELRVVVF